MKSIVVSCAMALAWTGIAYGAPETAPVPADSSSPSFRGPTGSGLYRGTAPASWSAKDKKGILWQATLDLPGWSSPIVYGDKVVVTSADSDKRTVYCFEAATGKPAWKTTVPAVDGATQDYKPDSQSDTWDKMLYAGSTPATDGKQVYAVFSNGQLAALELATGKHLWSKALGDTTTNKFGLDNSLLVYDGNVIVVFEGAQSFIAAYDATGKEQWKTKREGPTWASPILVKTKTGASLVVLSANPDVTAWDVKTGAHAWSTKVLTAAPEYCFGPSPVTDGERIYVNCDKNGIFALDPANGAVLWKLTELPDGSNVAEFKSMTTDGQRLYHFHQSILTVLDAKTGGVLAQPDMGTSSSETEASPMVVGDKLYLVCGDTTIVAKTGEKPEKIGEGTVNEIVYASPAYAAGRLFFRAGRVLYCIGQ